MRKRSLSVAVERNGRTDQISRKFEGVPSDNDDYATDADEESDVEGTGGEPESWTLAEYEKLQSQLRAILPKNDNKRYDTRLKTIEWERVAFDGHSPQSVEKVTKELLKKVRKFRTLSDMLAELPGVIKKSITAEKPKNPLTAFNYFVKEKYNSYKERHPGRSDLFKIMSQDFAILSEKKKMKYNQMVLEGKEAYKDQLKKFYEQNPEAKEIEGQHKTTKLANSKPSQRKRTPSAVTPYNIFLEQQIESDPTKTRSDIKKAWDALELPAKLKFIRYAFASGDKSKLNKKEKELLDQAAGKPEPFARTCCEYYLKFHAQPDSQLPITEWRKQKMQEYKLLPKVQRLELELEFRKERAKFVKKFREYVDALPESERNRELQFLQPYLDATSDNGEKKHGHPDGTDSAGHRRNVSVHDITDLPIAESTTHETNMAGKRKDKQKLPPVPSTPAASSCKPLKSILKTPTPVKQPSAKRVVEEEMEPSFSAPKKKHKKDKSARQESAEESSDSANNKSKNKTRAKLSEEEGQRSDSGNASKKSKATSPVNEPVAPAKTVVEYFRKTHYLGKKGKHKEAFEKLSTNRRKAIEAEMKAAQQQYVKDLQVFFKTLPKNQIERYVAKLKKADQAKESADEDDSETEEFDESMANSTKMEPHSSSDEEDSDDD
ncbi:nucleolar transcription factor 1-like [Anopheles bellator]|uniref:nucleolar transcription factor 1-like n=1 Tax=Anopheles bellator TaxID=139047 RepID=UPI0026471B40|nr:nucleolar transcription factor 1-like [Anopheles bellator]